MPIISVLHIILLIALFACSDEYDIDDTSDLDVTITDYDTAFDYSNLCKYYIDETINYDEGDNTDEVSEDIATEMFAHTQSNLDAKNYLRVNTQAEADIVVEYYVTSSNYVAVSDWYYQGDYWWWGYNGGWYIYSPVYSTYYMYTAGSLVTTMTSRALVDSEENPSPYWYSMLNGVVENNEESNKIRVENSLDQAFNQSPYLDRTTACTP